MDYSRWQQHFWESHTQCLEAGEGPSLLVALSRKKRPSPGAHQQTFTCFPGKGWGTTMITLHQNAITLWPDLEPPFTGMHVEKREKLNKI